MRTAFPLAAALLGLAAVVCAAPPEPKAPPAPADRERDDFRARLQAATAKHLDALLGPDGKVVALKGKGADGMTALAFYQMYELTGNAKYKTAAVALADRILTDMRATKHGVLYIKEKGTGDEAIDGGGPPAFGWYTTAAAYILHKEGGRTADLKYIAAVIDNYPWNKDGWWANAIDIKTGEPKEPLTKAGAVNKNAAMALCAGAVATYLKATDAELSAKLKDKADTCIYKQIIPAQEADGFWHYGLKGTDPKNKDVLGYFMVTTEALLQLQHLTGDTYRDKPFQAALDKACAFAAKHIAPMTDPNKGPAPPANRVTAGTPTHYTLADEPKRGFQLGVLLFAGKNHADGAKVVSAALRHFPHGNAGMDGAHAVQPCAMILSLLRADARPEKK